MNTTPYTWWSSSSAPQASGVKYPFVFQSDDGIATVSPSSGYSARYVPVAAASVSAKASVSAAAAGMPRAATMAAANKIPYDFFILYLHSGCRLQESIRCKPPASLPGCAFPPIGFPAGRSVACSIGFRAFVEKRFTKRSETELLYHLMCRSAISNYGEAFQRSR